MSLRLRTLLVIGATLLVLFAGLHAVSTAIFSRGVETLEQHQAERQMVLGRLMVEGFLAELGKHTRDWAFWDDTCDFMRNGNQAYVRSNLPSATFSQLDFDLFLYFRPDGTLHAGFAYDELQDAVGSPSAACVAAVRENRALTGMLETVPLVTGVIQVEGRPLMVAASPILTSAGEGPSSGTLMIGRYLTPARLQAAAEAAGLDLALLPPGGEDPPLSAAEPTLIRVEGDDCLAGYFRLADTLGRDVATIRVNTSRWIRRQVKTSERYLMLNLVVTGVIFLVVVMVLLNRLILARLARLDKGVATIRHAGDLDVRLPVQGRDELECLAATINDTLDTLQQTQNALRHDALHDPLTGLANRTLFFQRVEAAMETARREPCSTIAVLMIDIDHFKLINDSFGHVAGDELLILVARRLCLSFRREDTVARLGGDEFAVLLAPLKDENEALLLARRLLDHLRNPISWERQSLHLSASVGIAPCREYYSSPEQLLRDADTAMYRAKQGGRNCVALFDETMREEVVTHLSLQNDLRGAAGRGELRVRYQPLFELAGGRLHGFEALVRWDHPQLGMLSPARFIPLAESGGFMGEIDIWVFREACRCMSRWQTHYHCGDAFHMSVNLSCTHGQLLEVIPELCGILAASDIDGRCIGLEITESALAVAKGDFIRQLCALKAQGVRLYLDDFGTGHSSLSRLHQLPIDVLKIDRSFIAGLDAGKGEIARTIVTLAHGLGMTVVAEGVETRAQADNLREHGCDFGQGFLFSKPLTETDATRLLGEHCSPYIVPDTEADDPSTLASSIS